jgi:predicted nucleic acid-binding protein
MNFLLDTCTISAHIRRPAGLQARFIQYSGRLYLSSIALAELYVLAYRLDDPTPRLDAIEELIRDEVAVVDFSADAPASPAISVRTSSGEVRLSRRSTG